MIFGMLNSETIWHQQKNVPPQPYAVASTALEI